MEAMDPGAAVLSAVPSNGHAKGRLRAEDFASEASLLEEKEVEVPGMGTVLVRGFTKQRQRAVRKFAQDSAGEIDEEKMEVAMLWQGVVDPELTLEQAEHAYHSWPADCIDSVLSAIMQVSGMLPGFTREAVISFREEPGPGVRVPSGEGSGDDGGQTPEGDV